MTHGCARYRLPVMPVVFLIAGVGWVSWREGRIADLTGRRKAVAIIVAALLAVVLVPSFRLNIANPAFGLTDTGGREESPSP